MEISVKVPEELATEARARGLKLEVYVQEILARQAAAIEKTPHRRTPEEIRAWLDSLAQFSDKIPSLPEIISREWIYQDHN
jgi:post-segregation antitoxin (ccd killing protein)